MSRSPRSCRQPASTMAAPRVDANGLITSEFSTSAVICDEDSQTLALTTRFASISSWCSLRLALMPVRIGLPAHSHVVLHKSSNPTQDYPGEEIIAFWPHAWYFASGSSGQSASIRPTKRQTGLDYYPGPGPRSMTFASKHIEHTPTPLFLAPFGPRTCLLVKPSHPACVEHKHAEERQR